MDLLKSYDWRGNVRELKNVIERTCILTSRNLITSDDLSFLRVYRKNENITENQNESGNINGVNTPQQAGSATLSLKEMKRRNMISVLSLANGHRGKAASLLEINPKTLYLKMKIYNIISVYE